MGLVRVLRRIFMGERRQLQEVGIRSNPILNRGAHQDNSMCGQVPGPIGIVLSPEQKQHLMQMIAQKLESKKSNTTGRSKSSGS
jgi:hypothetical protein